MFALRATRLAVPFVFSVLLVACGGKTLDEGEPTTDAGVDAAPTTDSGISADWTSCTGPGQCAVVAKTCCGACSGPSLANSVALRTGFESKYRDSVCGPVPPGCPECAPFIADDSIQAWCQFGAAGGGGGAPAGKCTVVDVRTESVSACTTDADCMLRHSSCCEPCEERRDDLVALTPAGLEAYRSKVCVGDETCSRCASRYPFDARARCDAATRHCVVDWVDAPTGG